MVSWPSRTLVVWAALVAAPSLAFVGGPRPGLRVGPVRSTAESEAPPAEAPPAKRVITITPEAIVHIKKLRSDNGPDTHLRMGVRAGGCSGLSYSMDLCKSSDIVPEDHVELWEDDLKVVIDPKSMLYLFGLELGYSSELIGGGFQFNNPNAESSCGCGTSFGI